MFVPFEAMPASSRIWIYQSEKPLSPDQKNLAKDFLTSYCEQWAAHGEPLRTSFEIAYDHFVVLAVDESFNTTSGCSIDTSVNALKTLGEKIQVDFFNRELVAFKDEQVFFVELKHLKQKFLDGSLKENTLVFNNLIAEKKQLSTEWIRPAIQTWLKRYVPGPAIRI